MIFAHTHELVVSGRKTATRRLVKGDKPRCRVGQPLAVQPGRGQKAVCRVLVTEVSRARLGEMTDEDGRAEGYNDLQAFRAVWERMHGSWDPEAAVWVIRFQTPCCE
jgi:hypothetical protein